MNELDLKIRVPELNVVYVILMNTAKFSLFYVQKLLHTVLNSHTTYMNYRNYTYVFSIFLHNMEIDIENTCTITVELHFYEQPLCMLFLFIDHCKKKP